MKIENELQAQNISARISNNRAKNKLKHEKGKMIQMGCSFKIKKNVSQNDVYERVLCRVS